MDLRDVVSEDDVVFGVRAPDVAAAAAQGLRSTLPKHGFKTADVERIVQLVADRERQSPTLCGPIAIPHARDAALNRFVATVVVNPAGVTPDGPRILIAFVSPDGSRTEHLALLSSIARFSRDERAIDALAQARDAREVIEIIRARKS